MSEGACNGSLTGLTYQRTQFLCGTAGCIKSPQATMCNGEQPLQVTAQFLDTYAGFLNLPSAWTARQTFSGGLTVGDLIFNPSGVASDLCLRTVTAGGQVGLGPCGGTGGVTGVGGSVVEGLPVFNDTGVSTLKQLTGAATGKCVKAVDATGRVSFQDCGAGNVTVATPTIDKDIATWSGTLGALSQSSGCKVAPDATGHPTLACFYAPTDTQPQEQIGPDVFGNASWLFGPGGTTPADVRLRYVPDAVGGLLVLDRNGGTARTALVLGAYNTVDTTTLQMWGPGSAGDLTYNGSTFSFHGTDVNGTGRLTSLGVNVTIVSGTTSLLTINTTVTAAGQTRVVQKIVDSTHFRVSQAFSPDVSVATFTFRRSGAIQLTDAAPSLTLAGTEPTAQYMTLQENGGRLQFVAQTGDVTGTMQFQPNTSIHLQSTSNGGCCPTPSPFTGTCSITTSQTCATCFVSEGGPCPSTCPAGENCIHCFWSPAASCQVDADCSGQTAPKGPYCDRFLPGLGDGMLVQIGRQASYGSGANPPFAGESNPHQIAAYTSDNSNGCQLCALGAAEAYRSQNVVFGVFGTDNRTRTYANVIVSDWIDSEDASPIFTVKRGQQTLPNPVHRAEAVVATCSAFCGGAGACHLEPTNHQFTFTWEDTNTHGRTKPAPLTPAVRPAYGQEITVKVNGYCSGDDQNNTVSCATNSDCPSGSVCTPPLSTSQPNKRLVIYHGGTTLQLKIGEMTAADCVGNVCTYHVCGKVNGSSKCSNDSTKTCSVGTGTSAFSSDCASNLAAGSFPHGVCGETVGSCGPVNTYPLACTADATCASQTKMCTAGTRIGASCTVDNNTDAVNGCPGATCPNCCVAVCRGVLIEGEVPLAMNTTGLGYFDVYQDDIQANSDFPGRVVMREWAGGGPVLTFRNDTNALFGEFNDHGAYRMFRTPGDAQPILRIGDDEFGNGSILFGGGLSQSGLNLRLRWTGQAGASLDPNGTGDCIGGPRYGQNCASVFDCPGDTGDCNPTTHVCNRGAYVGVACTTDAQCLFACPGAPTTLSLGADNAGFPSTLRMWGPGPASGTLTFDGTSFIFNPPLPAGRLAIAGTGGVTFPGVAYANLPTVPDATIIYCSDCNGTCSGGSSSPGQFCQRRGSVWQAVGGTVDLTPYALLAGRTGNTNDINITTDTVTATGACTCGTSGSNTTDCGTGGVCTSGLCTTGGVCTVNRNCNLAGGYLCDHHPGTLYGSSTSGHLWLRGGRTTPAGGANSRPIHLTDPVEFGEHLTPTDIASAVRYLHYGTGPWSSDPAVDTPLTLDLSTTLNQNGAVMETIDDAPVFKIRPRGPSFTTIYSEGDFQVTTTAPTTGFITALTGMVHNPTVRTHLANVPLPNIDSYTSGPLSRTTNDDSANPTDTVRGVVSGATLQAVNACTCGTNIDCGGSCTAGGRAGLACSTDDTNVTTGCPGTTCPGCCTSQGTCTSGKCTVANPLVLARADCGVNGDCNTGQTCTGSGKLKVTRIVDHDAGLLFLTTGLAGTSTQIQTRQGFHFSAPIINGAGVAAIATNVALDVDAQSPLGICTCAAATDCATTGGTCSSGLCSVGDTAKIACATNTDCNTGTSQTCSRTNLSLRSLGNTVQMLHSGPVRIGDQTAPTEKLEVAGNETITGLLKVRSGLTTFAGAAGTTTATAAIEFANSALAPSASGKEFAYLNYHPAFTYGNTTRTELISEAGTYVSNAGTSNGSLTLLNFAGQATSGVANKPPVSVAVLSNTMTLSSTNVDNTTTAASQMVTVQDFPSAQVVGASGKLRVANWVGLWSLPSFFTDTAGQVLTIDHRAGVWVQAPVAPSGGPNVTIGTSVGIDIDDQVASGITYTNIPISLRSLGLTVALLHSGPVRIGDQTYPTEKLEVAGNAVLTGYANITEISPPAAPTAGKERCYAKASAGFCCKDSGGTERCTGSGGSGSVTSVSAGTGMSFTTITSTGAVSIDPAQVAILNNASLCDNTNNILKKVSGAWICAPDATVGGGAVTGPSTTHPKGLAIWNDTTGTTLADPNSYDSTLSLSDDPHSPRDSVFDGGRHLSYGVFGTTTIPGELKTSGFGYAESPGALWTGHVDNSVFPVFVDLGYTPGYAKTSVGRDNPPLTIFNADGEQKYLPLLRISGATSVVSQFSIREPGASTPGPDIFNVNEKLQFGTIKGDNTFETCAATTRGVCRIGGAGQNGALTCAVVAAKTFTASSSTDQLTITAHGYSTGNGPFQVSSTGLLPGNLFAGTNYFTIVMDANNFKLATSWANANTGTAIDLTSGGTGTLTIDDVSFRPWDGTKGGCGGPSQSRADGCSGYSNEGCGAGVDGGYCIGGATNGGTCMSDANCTAPAWCQSGPHGFVPNKRWYVTYDFEDQTSGDSRDPSWLADQFNRDHNCPECMNPTNRTAPSRQAYVDTPSTAGYRKLRLWFPKVCWDGTNVPGCSDTGASCSSDTDCATPWRYGMAVCDFQKRKTCTADSDCGGGAQSCAYMPYGASVSNILVAENLDASDPHNGTQTSSGFFRRQRVPRICTTDAQCSGWSGSCETNGAVKFCAGTYLYGNPGFAEVVQPTSVNHTSRALLDVYNNNSYGPLLSVRPTGSGDVLWIQGASSFNRLATLDGNGWLALGPNRPADRLDVTGHVILRATGSSDIVDPLDFRNSSQQLLAGFDNNGFFKLFTTPGDAQPSLLLDRTGSGGRLSFGPGGSQSPINDTILGRSGVGILTLVGKFIANAARLGDTTVPNDKLEVNGVASIASLNIGSAGGVHEATTGFLNFTTASAGTCGSGEYWQQADSGTTRLSGCDNGVAFLPHGGVFTATADKAATNTVTETSLVGTGVGSMILPANLFVAGRTLRIHAKGYYGTTSSPGNLTIRGKLGSTVVFSSVIAPTANMTQRGWSVDALVTCRTTGSSGTVMGHGTLMFANSAAGSGVMWEAKAAGVPPAAVTVNTTGSLVLDLTAQWATANPSNTVVTQVLFVEAID